MDSSDSCARTAEKRGCNAGRVAESDPALREATGTTRANQRKDRVGIASDQSSKIEVEPRRKSVLPDVCGSL